MDRLTFRFVARNTAKRWLKRLLKSLAIPRRSVTTSGSWAWSSVSPPSRGSSIRCTRSSQTFAPMPPRWRRQPPKRILSSSSYAPSTLQAAKTNFVGALGHTLSAALCRQEEHTLVGLLPVPHPILCRKYQPSRHTSAWFTTFLWGVIYLQHQARRPPRPLRLSVLMAVVWAGAASVRHGQDSALPGRVS